jgi:hypothetical protein
LVRFLEAWGEEEERGREVLEKETVSPFTSPLERFLSFCRLTSNR